MTTNDTKYHNIDEILDKKYDPATMSHMYLVKWEGFNRDHNTWEPESSLLEDVPEMVVDYNDKMEEQLYEAHNSQDFHDFIQLVNREDDDDTAAAGKFKKDVKAKSDNNLKVFPEALSQQVCLEQ